MASEVGNLISRIYYLDFNYLIYLWSCSINRNYNYLISVLNIKTSVQYDNGVIGAASFFAFAAMVAYGADLFFRFREWKSGQNDNQTDQQKAGGAPNTVEV